MSLFHLRKNVKKFASMAWAAGGALVALVCVGILSPSDLAAQSTGSAPIPLPRLTGPISLDGEPDDAAWARVPPLTMTQHEPVFGIEPTERSVVRVAYDREHIYPKTASWSVEEPTLRRLFRLTR